VPESRDAFASLSVHHNLLLGLKAGASEALLAQAEAEFTRQETLLRQNVSAQATFDQAKAKLYEARFLFEELGDHDSMRTVRGVLDEISRQQALDRTDSDEQ
jgi:multidrug efflux pump subunit AcrA (membrane-fusion protein)